LTACQAARQYQGTYDTYGSKKTLAATALRYDLYWKNNATHVTFEISVDLMNETTFVLFAIGNPATNQADGVLAWLNPDSTGYFASVHVNTMTNTYTVDPNPNWIPLNAQKTQTAQVFQFVRNVMVVCGSARNQAAGDIDITTGLNQVVYSVGSSINLIQSTVSLGTVQKTNLTLLASNTGPFTCVQPPPVQTFNSTPTDIYENNADLAPLGNFRLYWNYTDTQFIAEVHARTLGWVGFGFSPNGGMVPANVFVAWQNADGSGNFTERYNSYSSSGLPKVLPTQTQNWRFVALYHRNGYTIVKFTRPIILCGQNEVTIPVSCII
jgi:hypothetical protein